MSFEAFTYFEIILAGFVAVWTFRHFSKSQAKISDFEYLGWSSFWGLVLLVIMEGILKNYPKLNELIANPFATGLFLSIFGIILGSIIGSKLTLFIKKIEEWRSVEVNQVP